MPDNTAPTTAARLTGVFFGAEMTPTETAALLRQYNQWRRGNLEGQPQPDPREIGEAIDAAIEMIERSAKLEQALQAMTKAYKSVPYTQWPAEMHFANEVLEKSK